jgi:hypothetical protein
MAGAAQWQLRPRWPSDATFDFMYSQVMRRVGFSAPGAIAVLHGLRAVTQRREDRERAQEARRLGASEDARGRALSSNGFCTVEPGILPGADAAVSLCRELAQSARERPDALHSPRGYGPDAYFRNILSGRDFLRHPAIVDFLTSEPLVRSIAGYLGSVPWLTNVSLLWTSPNDLTIGPQRFHFDHVDTKQIKLFIAIEDISLESGPTMFFDLKASDAIKAKLGRGARKRMKDEKVFAVVPRERLQCMTGPAGFAYILDTCRCVHYGARAAKRERLVLVANYNQVTVPRMVEQGDEKRAGPIELSAQPLTPLQQMVLRIIPS